MKKNRSGKNKNRSGNLFGPEVFADEWIFVTDRNKRDIQVTVDELFEIPLDKSDVEVFYDGQRWWINKNLHFPVQKKSDCPNVRMLR